MVMGMDYSIATFRDNAAETGVLPALSKDWSKTKQHVAASLDGLLGSSLLAREKADYLEPGKKVTVMIPACSDCNSPPIQRKGIIAKYLGMEDPTRGRINGYPVENRYRVQLEKGEEITCFESNLH